MVKTHGFPVDFPNKTNPVIEDHLFLGSSILRAPVILLRHQMMSSLRMNAKNKESETSTASFKMLFNSQIRFSTYC